MGEYDVGEDVLLLKLPRTRAGLPRAGNVTIHATLGKGGIGAVYLGFDEKLAVEVAVKVLSFHSAADRSIVERFFREARSMVRLDHPNIVRVLTVDEQAGVYYLVMEFVDGESADVLVKREGPLPERDALEVAVAVGEALAAAHDEGILHRDVKPGNIMIRFHDGRVKLADLGLAKALGGEGSETTGLTASGQMLGTPAYMSPEQAEDASRADERSDVYSLGATLYALLTGKPPFNETQLFKLLVKVTQEEPEDLLKLRPDVTEETDDVVKKLMAKNPATRPPSMDAAVGLLRECLASAPGEDARGLARPEMAGKRELKPTIAELTSELPGPAPEDATDGVLPETVDYGAGRGAAAEAEVGVDEVVEKRLDVEERRSRYQPGGWEGEGDVLHAADRDVRVAKEIEDRDTAAALDRLERAEEALSALEERQRVLSKFDLDMLKKFAPEGHQEAWAVVEDADGRLRSRDRAAAQQAYREAEKILLQVSAVASERRTEYERLTPLLEEQQGKERLYRDELTRFDPQGHEEYARAVGSMREALESRRYEDAAAAYDKAEKLLQSAHTKARKKKEESERLAALLGELKEKSRADEDALARFNPKGHEDYLGAVRGVEEAIERGDCVAAASRLKDTERVLHWAVAAARVRSQVARRVIPQLEEMERKALAHEGLLNRFNRAGYEEYLGAVRQVPEAIGRRDYGAAREKCEVASLLLSEAVALARRQRREHGPGAGRVIIAILLGAALGAVVGGVVGVASVPVILVGVALGAVGGAVLVAVVPRLGRRRGAGDTKGRKPPEDKSHGRE